MYGLAFKNKYLWFFVVVFFKSTILVSFENQCLNNPSPSCFKEWQVRILKNLSKRYLIPLEERTLRLKYNFTVEVLENIDAVEQLFHKYEILEEMVNKSKELIYHPLEIEAVNKVFDTFGELYIGNEEVPINWEAKVPWAGHWYPKNKTTLFGSTNAPLQKLQRILRRLGFHNQIVKWEEENFSLASESWEGLCTSWAIASVRTSEPRNNIYSGEEVLSIADQKAIITKLHENFAFDVFGIFYRGNASTDGTYQDLRPEAFHRIMSVLLGERGEPFIVDDDAATEVWSKPVFKVIWHAHKNSKDERMFDVFAKVYMIKHRAEENEKPTSIWEDSIIHNYSYRLIVDPLVQENNKFKVIAGEWIDASWTDHPDVVIVPKVNSKMSSFNPEIESNMERIEKILGLN